MTPGGLSLLDRAYSALAHRQQFFSDGLGDPAFLARVPGLLAGREPAPADVVWERRERSPRGVLLDGSFESPLAADLPPVSRRARVRLLLPRDADQDTPLCIHLAATGDEGYLRRTRLMALPLLSRGVGSLLLENPYYGARRPEGQVGCYVRTLCSFWRMGIGAIVEGWALVRWLRATGRRRVAVTGVSMGGSITTFLGGLVREPVACVPCITPHSPSAVFLEGVLSRSVAWGGLAKDLAPGADAREALRSSMGQADARAYPPPFAPAAVRVVAARHDAFVPVHSVEKLCAHWQTTPRWLSGGHVGAALFRARAFRAAIVSALRAL